MLALSAPVAYAAGFVSAMFLSVLAVWLCKLSGLAPFGPDHYPASPAPPADRPQVAAPKPPSGPAVAVPGESPVFRRGMLVGFLRHNFHEGSTVWVAGEGAAVRLRKIGGAWDTEAIDLDLAGLPAATFRMLALLLALLALPIDARAMDVSNSGYTFHPAEMSQYGHRPGMFEPGETYCAVGFVESVRTERDKDLHVWLCETFDHRNMDERRQDCVLGEIAPSAPLLRPHRGDHVRMCGRWVEADSPHGWTELHPLTSLIEVRP